MSEAGTPRKEPTASEAMFFYAIVKHTKNKADIDWSAVAVEQGFKNAEVAKVRFGQVKRKLGIAGDGNTPTRATPKKNGGASTNTTPTKVTKAAGRAGTKGRGGAKGKVKKEEANDDDDVKDPPKTPKQEDEEDGANAQIHSEMDPDADPF